MNMTNRHAIKVANVGGQTGNVTDEATLIS
jgi:hypothetical protein